MMNLRRFRILAVVCIVCTLFLFGCGREKLPQTTEPSSGPVPDSPTIPATQMPAETVMPTNPPAITEAAPTEAASRPVSPELPYLQKVTHADQSIFDGPGYDYAFAGTVKEAGTYTIVEEAWDVEDNLWGRLKSGAGWIDLTQVRKRIESPDALSANYADDLLLGSGNYHHYVRSSEEYALRIAFRARETLTDVRLYSMAFHETLELEEELFFLSRLEPEKPLVADLDFPGDMSTYAILFTDSSSNQTCLCISISGRNGTLELWEYEP